MGKRGETYAGQAGVAAGGGVEVDGGGRGVLEEALGHVVADASGRGC